MSTLALLALLLVTGLGCLVALTVTPRRPAEPVITEDDDPPAGG